MAVAYLSPDAASGTSGWNGSYSSTASHLAQGETSNEWRSVFLSTAKATFTLSDFSQTFSSITKIEHVIVCRLDARGGSAVIQGKIMDGTGPSSYYTENFTNPAGALLVTLTGTARTTSDGSSAWTDSDLDGLGLQITCTGGPFVHVIQQMYIKVTYVEPSGYGNAVNGIAATDISEINGIATASISKVNGV